MAAQHRRRAGISLEDLLLLDRMPGFRVLRNSQRSVRRGSPEPCQVDMPRSPKQGNQQKEHGVSLQVLGIPTVGLSEVNLDLQSLKKL